MAVWKKGSKEPRLPGARAGHLFALAKSRHEAFLVGGYDEGGALADVWKYDLQTEQWHLLRDPAPQGRGRRGAAPAPTPLPRMEYDGCCLGAEGGLIDIGSGTVFSSAAASSVLPCRVYVFGGMQFDGDQVLILNDLWYLDCCAAEARWTLVSEECPCPERAGHVCVAISDSVMVVHGGDCMRPLGDAWCYCATTNSWFPVGVSGGDSGMATGFPTPSPRSQHSAAYCCDLEAVAIFGGMTTVPSAGGGRPEPIHLNDLWLLHCPMPPSSAPLDAAWAASWRWTQVSCAGIAPSPRDLPSVHYQPGLGLLILGGFGLSETSGSHGEDDGQGGQDALGALGAAVGTMGIGEMSASDRDGEEDRIEVTYLGDAWLLSLKSGYQVVDAVEFDISDAVGTAEDSEFGDESESEEDVDLPEEETRLALQNPAVQQTEPGVGTIQMQHSDDDKVRRDMSGKEKEDEDEDEDESIVVIGPPRRGAKVISLGGSALFTFGGFDGESFCGATELIQMDRVRRLLGRS